MLIHRLVRILLLFVDAYFGFFLKLDGLLGFESLLWHSNGSEGGKNNPHKTWVGLREILGGGWTGGIPDDNTIAHNCCNIVAG